MYHKERNRSKNIYRIFTQGAQHQSLMVRVRGGFERECEWHVRRDPFQFALAFSYTFNSPQMGN